MDSLPVPAILPPLDTLWPLSFPSDMPSTVAPPDIAAEIPDAPDGRVGERGASIGADRELFNVAREPLLHREPACSLQPAPRNAPSTSIETPCDVSSRANEWLTGAGETSSASSRESSLSRRRATAAFTPPSTTRPKTPRHEFIPSAPPPGELQTECVLASVSMATSLVSTAALIEADDARRERAAPSAAPKDWLRDIVGIGLQERSSLTTNVPPKEAWRELRSIVGRTFCPREGEFSPGFSKAGASLPEFPPPKLPVTETPMTDTPPDNPVACVVANVPMVEAGPGKRLAPTHGSSPDLGAAEASSHVHRARGTEARSSRRIRMGCPKVGMAPAMDVSADASSADRGSLNREGSKDSTYQVAVWLVS
eukprot:scaffold201170_cov33-Tisochrysis_lutea.AAC.10